MQPFNQYDHARRQVTASHSTEWLASTASGDRRRQRQWRWLVTILLCAIIALLHDAEPAGAQTGEDERIAAAALSAADAPAFHAVDERFLTMADLRPAPGPGEQQFETTFVRNLAANAGDQTGDALLIVRLSKPPDGVPLATLQTVTRSGAGLELFRDFDNYRRTGSLGIGDDDQAAVWDRLDDVDGAVHTVYADIFLRGRLYVAVFWDTPSDRADPSLVRAYARLQDQKLSSDSLPSELAGAAVTRTNALMPLDPATTAVGCSADDAANVDLALFGQARAFVSTAGATRVPSADPAMILAQLQMLRERLAAAAAPPCGTYSRDLFLVYADARIAQLDAVLRGEPDAAVDESRQRADAAFDEASEEFSAIVRREQPVLAAP